MTFLHPALFAAGAACVAIPIIIHLLMHRRRKPVMWGAMRFLVEAYKRQRRRLMIEKWLLLAVRCLVVGLLAFAVGRPLLEKFAGSGPGGRTVYLLIDNGVASSARDGFGASALERHKATALAVVEAIRAGQRGSAESDRVGLITMGGPSAPVVVPPSANLGSIESLIEELSATDSRTDVPGALALVAGALGAGEAGEGGEGGRGRTRGADRTLVVLISDLTEGSAEISSGGDGLGTSRLPGGVRLVVTRPRDRAIENVAITAVEPLRTVLVDSSRGGGASGGVGGMNGSELARVRLTRSGEGVSRAAVTTIRSRLALARGGGKDAAGQASSGEQTVVRWAPGQETAYAVVPVRADEAVLSAARGASGAGPTGSAGGVAGVEVVLTVSIDDDAIGADNRWRRPISLREQLRVGVVAPIRFGRPERVDALDPGSWARLALQPAGEGASGIEVTDIEPASLDQSRLAGLDAVIVARPDLVGEASWARIRVFVEGGGLAMITPPPGVTTHVWGDAMARGLGTEWAPAREAKSVSGQRLARSAGGPGGDGENGGSGGGGAGLLALVEGELDELLGAVSVEKTLPLDPAPAADAGRPMLGTADGTTILWMIQPGRGTAAGRPGEGAGRGAIVYLGVPLDLESSDLPAKPLMVPLMQELVRQGVGRARGSWWSVAGSRPALPSRTAELRPLADPAGATGREGSDAGAQAIAAGPDGSVEPVRHAGVYGAVDERGATRGIVAVNADPRGTNTRTQDVEPLGSWLRGAIGTDNAAEAAEQIVWIPGAGGGEDGAGPDAAGVTSAVAGMLGSGDRGTPVSLPLLIGALALAILEVLVARRASHAEVAGDAGEAPGAARGVGWGVAA